MKVDCGERCVVRRITSAKSEILFLTPAPDVNALAYIESQWLPHQSEQDWERGQPCLVPLLMEGVETEICKSRLQLRGLSKRLN